MATSAQKDLNITGSIQIHTDNILPIIKKWLYSEHEIFVRELVSNACDAITKLKTIAVKEGLDCAPAEGLINITLNTDEKTITLSDNGLGMDAEEIQKYINQIAFSGAEEFVKKYQDTDNQAGIIGHFGLGFYSAFIVAEKVEIYSLSYKNGAQAVHWECDGSTQFSLTSTHKATVGTDIVLHIGEENQQFLEENKLKDLVKKYANFLPYDIQVNGTTVNNKNPLWTKTPTETTEDEYKAFYQTLFPFSEPPLFWIHLNVDHPFNLKGILYFPKLAHELDGSKGDVKLFCQQVFVSDNVKDVIPEFLTLLRGAIDCPDIPLNVSRSTLQNDPYVQKIAKHIVKKVADKLNELHKNDKASFEKYWEDIHPFIKYGMMNNQDFYEKVKDSVIFKSSSGESTNLSAYLERNQAKLDKKILYCSNKDTQATYVSLCKDQGLEVLYVNSVIDSHFIQFLESKDPTLKFVSVDTHLSDHLLDSSTEESNSADSKAKKETLAELFKKHLGKDTLKIQVEPLKSTSISGMLLESEQMKRFKEMSVMMRREFPDMLVDHTLVLNTNNPVIQNITQLESSGKTELAKELCEHVYDLAMMSHTPLSGEKMQAFISRSNKLLTQVSLSA